VRKSARLAFIGIPAAFAGWGLLETGTEETRPLPEPSRQGPSSEAAGTTALAVGLPEAPRPTPAAEQRRPVERRTPLPRSKPPSSRTPRVAIHTAAERDVQPRIGSTEVTVSRFRACVEAGACKTDHFSTDSGAPCNWSVEGHDEHPMNCVDWNGASEFCAFDGGRLCKPDEWFTACRGPSDWDYPYGPAFQADACLARTGIEAMKTGTEPVGQRESCQGGTPGAYDMGGNVAEWVDECDGTYCHMYGGAYVTNEPADLFASCKRVCAGNQKTFYSATIGFRCCYDDP
jgi:hypothetical protein